MNWTGGRLSRHSNEKGALRARQKQHFAKVQANLRSGTKKQSPLKFSLFGKITEETADGSRPTSSCNLSPHGNEGSQAVLPHQNNHCDTHVALYDDPHTLSQKPQENGPNRVLLMKREVNSIPDDDLYSATPRPLGRKRKRELSSVPSGKRVMLDQGEEPASERRQRILRRGDWVGVSLQRPLQLAFASPNDVDLVGRRRKVTDGHRAQYNYKIQSLIGSPFTKPNLGHSQRNIDGQGQEMAHLGRADVRISIGGRVVPPGISSSSGPGRSRQPSERSHLFEQSQRSSSDVMLLDNEDIAGRKLRASEAGIYPENRKLVIHGNRSNLYNEEQCPHCRILPAGIEDGEYQSSCYDFPHGSYNGSRLQEVGRDLEYWSPDEYYTSARGHDHGRNSKGFDIVGVKNGEPIVSSSTTSLRHPKPRTSKISLLLRSDSSDIAQSTVAQVGILQPIVPSSQAVDSQIWESWVGELLDEQSQLRSDVLREQTSTQPMSISPGVSNVNNSRHAKKTISLEYSDPQFSTVSELGRSSKNGGDELALTSPQSLSVDREELYNGESFCPRIDAESKGNLLVAHAKAAGDAFEERLPKHAVRDEDQPVEKSAESDLDRIWQKFVFGSSDDEIEAIDSSDKKPIPPLCVQGRGSLASSMVAVPSTENSTYSTIFAGSQFSSGPSSRYQRGINSSSSDF
jgi:hypothetical protein